MYKFFILCLALSVQLCANFQTDYSKALELASQQQEPLLLFFNGSDWSGLGMKMKNEILTSAEFNDAIEEKMVCVEIDFPRYHDLPEPVAKLNQTLLKRFSVSQFPSLILIDSEQREIARLGYIPETGAAFAADLLKLLETDKIVAQMSAKIETLTSEELQKGYQLALELQQRDVVARFLEVGSHCMEPTFFLVEKYRQLVEEGGADTSQAEQIHKKIFQADPNNELGHLFTIALLQFQARSDRELNLSAEQVIAPLQNYLLSFGEQDCENVWRIEMMIAQFYLEQDEWRSALRHAEVAYENAPLSKRPEMEYSLDYIKKQASQTARAAP